MSEYKDIYRELCKKEPSIPIFIKDYWLDAVSEEGAWDVALEIKGEEVFAALPYFIKKKKGFNLITTPKLTPYMGPWIKYPADQKYAKKLSYEKKTFENLIAQLPPHDHFIQNFSTGITNWLPFYWHGFEETTRYTYTFQDLEDPDAIYKGFKDNIRRQIKKAKKKLKIVKSNDIQALHQLAHKMYDSRGNTLPYSLAYLQRIDKACTANKCRELFFAIDEEEKLYSALYLIWDANSSYYLIGCSDPAYKNSGAMSWLIWEAIQYSATVTQSFNFEGSMIEPIERFFRSFGARQTPYFQVSKTNSNILQLRNFLLSLKK